MAIVIGKLGKNVTAEHAMDHVFGYTTAHDVSARDWQLRKNGGQWLIGKTMDGFCPLGIMNYAAPFKTVVKFFHQCITYSFLQFLRTCSGYYR